MELKEENRNYNFGVRSIKKIIEENNIKIKSAKDYNRMYICKNENCFSEYTKFSCYWAGFIAADGCVFKRKNSKYPKELIFSLTDKESVYGLKEFIGYTGEVKIIKRVTNFSGKAIKYDLRVNCIKIVEDLNKNFNITTNKTLTYSPPCAIPEKLRKYFLLGYMDGDGSLSYYSGIKHHLPEWKGFNLNITGTYEICEYYKKVLNKENIKLNKRYKERENNNFTLNIQGNQQLYEILRDWYDDDEINKICMKRKYEKFLMLKQQIENK